MTPRNTAIVSALSSGATLAAVAAEHGLSRARVGQIYRAAKGKPRAAGRPVSTGRGSGAVVNVRLAPSELDAISTAAGGRARAAEYLRAAGLSAAATHHTARGRAVLARLVDLSAGDPDPALELLARLLAISSALGVDPGAVLDGIAAREA